MEFFTTRPPVFWGTLFYIVAVFGICALMLGLSHVLGGRGSSRSKNEPFEAGVVSSSPERLRLSAKFYLVAMFFVIFDVEALFLYAWAVSVREVGWTGFAEATVFIAVLFAGLVYLWKIGALEWSPNSRKKLAIAAARKAREAEAARERPRPPTPQAPLP